MAEIGHVSLMDPAMFPIPPDDRSVQPGGDEHNFVEPRHHDTGSLGSPRTDASNVEQNAAAHLNAAHAHPPHLNAAQVNARSMRPKWTRLHVS